MELDLSRAHRRIRRYLRDPSLLRGRERLPQEVALGLVDFCDEWIDLEPIKGKRIASLAIRASVLTKENWIVAKAFGALANAHRALGNLTAARRTFDVAFEIADNKKTVGELHRRRTLLRLLSEGVEAADEEISRALRIFDSEADIEQRAKCLLYVGNVRYFQGKYEEALGAIDCAIKSLDPKTRPRFFRAALHNVAAILAEGDLRDVQKASRLAQGIRDTFRGTRGLNLERAHLMWLQGLIDARLGLGQRGVNRLTSAYQSFVALRMPTAAVAVAADQAQIVFPSAAGIRAIAKRALTISGLPPNVEHAVQRLLSADKRSYEGPGKETLVAIENLRQAADVSTPPVLQRSFTKVGCFPKAYDVVPVEIGPLPLGL